ATRRLRSDLKTFASLVEPSWMEETRTELKWLGELLGDVRDMDVLLGRFEAAAPDLAESLGPLFESLDDQRRSAFSRLLEALTSPRYIELLDRIDGARVCPPLTPEAHRLCCELLPPLTLKAWKKARRKMASLGPEASDGDLHRLRILVKRTRYAAEAAAGPLQDKRVGKFANRAADVQDALGEIQDALTARATIERVLEEKHGPEVTLAAGRLLEREMLAASQARRVWTKPWSKLDDKKLVAWMRS
ncbi:MAG TPA: CHAD domain-containing protein, partial [Actinomycetota bacterium]|nr:CHAD domain-containing protein [Actinomycetota bacterium]